MALRFPRRGALFGGQDGIGLTDQVMPMGLIAPDAALMPQFKKQAPAPTQAGLFNADQNSAFDNPLFQLGASLLAGSYERNGMATALPLFTQMRQATNTAQLRRAQQEHQQRVLDETMRSHQVQEQRLADQLGISREQLQLQVQAMQNDQDKLRAQMPLWQAQAQAATANARHNDSQVLLAQEQAARQADLLKRLPAMLGEGAGTVPQAPPAMPAAPMPRLQPQSGPAMGLKPAGLTAVQMTESGGNPNAVGAAGERGSYQVMADTARAPGYGVTPAANGSSAELDRVGNDYFQSLNKQYGNPLHAMVAYNWGPGNADRWIKSGADPTKLPPSVRQYVGTNMLYQQLGYPLPGQAGSGAVPPVDRAAVQRMSKAGVLAAAAMDPKGLPEALQRHAANMEPKSYAAGSYVAGADGRPQFMPDPYRSAESQRADTKLGMETSEFLRKNVPGPGGLTEDARQGLQTGAFTQQIKQLGDAAEKYATVPRQIAALQQAREIIPKSTAFIGKGAENKLEFARLVNHNLGWLGVQIKPEQVTNADQLKSLLMEQVRNGLRQMDANPTQQQMEILMRATGDLTRDPNALIKILDFTEQELRRSIDAHNTKVDQAEQRAPGAFAFEHRIKMPEPAQRVPQGQPAPSGPQHGGAAVTPQPGEPVVEFNDWFKQNYKPQRRK